MRRSEEQQRLLLQYVMSHYTYDRTAGVVRNRKGQVIKGFDDKDGYLLLNMWLADGRHVVKLHRLVWVLCRGCLPTQIDHLNGNPKDNRIENLREVSYSENNMNRLLAWKPNPSTGLPGVYKSKNRFKINVQGKELYFRDKYEAFHALTMLGRMFRPDER